MKYFLSGVPRVGKTTALKKIIAEIGSEKFSGFYSEEVVVNYQRTGFKVISLDGTESIFASIYSNSLTRVGRYGIDIKKFENIAIHSINKSLNQNKIIVIDEIGPMQISSNKFLYTIENLLESSHTVLGTIYFDSHPVIDKIKQKKDINTFHLNKHNNKDIIRRIQTELNQIIRDYL